MRYFAFELPKQTIEAVEALRLQRMVLVYVKSLPSLERTHMRTHIRDTVRELLSQYAGVNRQDVQIDNHRGVAPSLRLHDQTYYLSIAYSPGISCVALALDAKVGVDVVDLNEIEGGDGLLQTAAIFLSPCALQSLQKLSGESLILAFSREWACREAVLKLCGQPMVEWNENSPDQTTNLSVEFCQIGQRFSLAIATATTPSSNVNS